MNAFGALLTVHVVVAVLGVGALGAVPIAAGAARTAGMAGASPFDPRPILARLLGWTRWSFIAMLITGAALDLAADGAFHGLAWFRASAVLLVVGGIAQARARAALRDGAGVDPGLAMRKVQRWGWTSCAAVALIAWLMAVKPFS
jgi:hypothetical protein